MNCEEAIRLVEKLADGEASEHEKSQAESHLGRCADCRSHYDFVLALSEASANAPSPEPPSSYWELLPSKVLSR